MARAIDSHTSTGDVAGGHEGDHESGETHANTPNPIAEHHQHEIQPKHAEGNVNDNE